MPRTPTEGACATARGDGIAGPPDASFRCGATGHEEERTAPCGFRAPFSPRSVSGTSGERVGVGCAGPAVSAKVPGGNPGRSPVAGLHGAGGAANIVARRDA